MAVEDFDAAQKGLKVEVVAADHQNKPDLGSNIVRTWLDVDKVDVIVDVPTSSVALAVNEIVREKNKVFLISGAASSDLTGAKCSPNSVHWTYDTWALANGTGRAIVENRRRHLVFPHGRLRVRTCAGGVTTASVIEASGGKVHRKVRHPLNTSEFLVVPAAGTVYPRRRLSGLANAGGDTINAIKQAAEFGIVQRGQNLAGLLVFINDVHALGLRTAQGLIMTEAFYWDRNDADTSFRQAIRTAVQGQHAEHGAGRRLRCRAALSQSGRGPLQQCRPTARQS